MPESLPKAVLPGNNVRLNSKTAISPGVDPIKNLGGIGIDPTEMLQADVTALQAANSALTDRVADLEKQMVAVRLVLQGIDPAFAALKQQIETFQTQYATHVHSMSFSFESLPFLLNTGDNNKPNFLIPYVWEGQNPGWTDFQRQQNASLASSTSTPKQKAT